MYWEIAKKMKISTTLKLKTPKFQPTNNSASTVCLEIVLYFVNMILHIVSCCD